MYTPENHPCLFTHTLRLDQLPIRFQSLIRDWARHLPSEERLQYFDGEFYMVAPFEMLNADTITHADLQVFTRRFNRLHDVGNHEALDTHIASYPFTNWMAHEEALDNYIEMMFLLHHLKTNLPPELVKPATLAIFVHE